MAFKPCRLIVEQTGLCFLRFTLCEGSLYRNVIIETAPIRDGYSAVRVTGLPGTNSYARRPATIQPHTCNLAFLVHLCSAAPHSRIPDLYNTIKHPKAQFAICCSPSTGYQTHTPASGSSVFPIPYHSVMLLPSPFMLI